MRVSVYRENRTFGADIENKNRKKAVEVGLKSKPMLTCESTVPGKGSGI